MENAYMTTRALISFPETSIYGATAHNKCALYCTAIRSAKRAFATRWGMAIALTSNFGEISAMIKQALGALTLIGTMATANAGTLLQEDFNNVSGLAAAGWVFTNASANVGSAPTWFQGVPSIMTAQSGADYSYVAANYNSASDGAINNWLITPTFSVQNAGSVSFFARADLFDGFSDQIAFGMSDGSAALGAFTLSAAFTVPGSEWTRYVLDFAGMGAGAVARFGIQYGGSYEGSNFVGVDSLLVTTVPEPATGLMFGAGLLGLMAMRRRRNRG
jgi:hypothetical protein